MPYLFIRYNRRYEKLDCSTIRYVEAGKNYCKIYTTHHLFMIMSTLKVVEAALPAGEFCRIHRSFIVSVAHINSFDHQVVYLQGKQLPVGSTWLPRLLRCLPILGAHSVQRTPGMRSQPSPKQLARATVAGERNGL
jgi:DNA-binding LytR/AlgR family response regulator